MPKPSLILTADDFCLAEFIDQGIIQAARARKITHVSAMMNFPKSVDKVKGFSQNFPQIPVGVHLNVTAGGGLSSPKKIPSLLDKDGQFYRVEDLFLNLFQIHTQEIAIELRNQVERFYETGLAPDHISYHQNVLTLYPPFWREVVTIAKETSIPLRFPIPASMAMPKTFGYAATRKKRAREVGKYVAMKKPWVPLRFSQYVRASALRKTQESLWHHKLSSPQACVDAFYGKPQRENLDYILANLSQGMTEIIFHPGATYTGGTLVKGINPNYIHPRQLELQTLLNFPFEEIMLEKGITWGSFASKNMSLS